MQRVKLEIRYGEDSALRRFPLQGGLAWLQQKMDDLIEPAPEDGVIRYRLFYQDDEDDWILIGGELEWRECLHITNGALLRLLAVIVGPEYVPAHGVVYCSRPRPGAGAPEETPDIVQGVLAEEDKEVPELVPGLGLGDDVQKGVLPEATCDGAGAPPAPSSVSLEHIGDAEHVFRAYLAWRHGDDALDKLHTGATTPKKLQCDKWLSVRRSKDGDVNFEVKSSKLYDAIIRSGLKAHDKRTPAAVQLFSLAIQLDSTFPLAWYNRACSRLVFPNGLPEEFNARTALDDLAKAVACGYHSCQRMQEDTDLAALRGHPEFAGVVEACAQNAQRAAEQRKKENEKKKPKRAVTRHDADTPAPVPSGETAGALTGADLDAPPGDADQGPAEATNSEDAQQPVEAPTTVVPHRYAEEVAQLEGMGFPVDEGVLGALEAAEGNVAVVLESLLGA
eukprot:TRINITY_DN1088_c1_g1_i1.p1 TRINITY_DN1088_c1_g1~~TRINITY_DN1088_c1_g1_i1.p1  ORF type:complete len:449 (+),score=136.88 TRINITY_DN1088_c1_g1_i1:69-1415(+)